jgi:hypothetical protein
MECFNSLSKPMQALVNYCISNGQDFVADMHQDMTPAEQDQLTVGEIRESVARAAKEFFSQEVNPDSMDESECPPFIATAIDERVASFDMGDLL